MDKQEIIAQLEYFTGIFPRAALAAAITNRQEMVPELLRFIAYAREHAVDIREDEIKEYMGHTYALYLLSQFREHSAYAPIVDLFGGVPDKIIHDITGDVITEDLHRMLPSVCNGDDSLIKSLVENEQAGPYVRAAAIESLVTMVVNGIKSRDEVIGYYTKLFREVSGANLPWFGTSWSAQVLILIPRNYMEKSCGPMKKACLKPALCLWMKWKRK